MMKSFFKELFEYNHHFNQKIISILIENPGKPVEPITKLVSHILNAHQIWNSRIHPGPSPSGPWAIHPINEFQKMDKQNFEASMDILDRFELEQIIQYSTSNGNIFNHRVRDILFQVINHSTYHRGQIAAQFRQQGFEPVMTDYIFYKMN